MAYYATDRVILTVSGVQYEGELISVNWTIRNNARTGKTMTNTRLANVVILDNREGDATIVEQILQGVPMVDWLSFDWNGATLEVHPASDTYNAPPNMVVYNGQVRILNVLAADSESEDYAGVGQGATRSLRLILSNATYQ